MKLLLIILLSLLCYFSFANTYYVSYSTGNDANTAAQAQSPATPWKTLDKIITGMSSGTIVANSTILLKRGDAWLMPRDFIINRGLTFDQYGPGNIKPYVTGLLSVTQGRWTLKDATAGIWETTDTIVNPRSNTLNLVLINGVSYAMGRTPNANAANKGWLNYESHTSTSVTDSQSPFDASYNGTQIVVRTNHTNIERGTVSTISGTTINFSTSGWGTSVNGTNGYGYFLQNSLKCLDQFGEWYYNAGTKKLSVCVGQLNNPNNFNIQYPYLDTMIQPKASNVIFRNLQLTGANRYIIYNDWAGLTNIWIRVCDLAYSGGDLVCFLGKTYTGIDSSTGMYANSNAFVYSYHNNGVHISNTYIHKIGTFSGMLWKDSPFRYGFGIFSSGQQSATDTGLQCKNVTIVNTGYSGIFTADNNNVIDGVFVDTTCYNQDDGACVYIDNYTTAGNTPKVMRGNVFMNSLVMHALGAGEGTPGNSPNSALAHGYYWDDNTNSSQILNNTAAYNKTAGIFVHNSNRGRIEGNLLYGNGSEQLYIQDDNIGDSVYKDTIRYNTLMPLNTSQLAYYFALDNTTKDSKNFNTWGIINNNVLAMPFSTNVAHLNHFGGVLDATYNLSNWRSTWNYDINSTGMPLTITDPNKINFVYNTSTANSNSFSFPCDNYVSTDNVSYFNMIMLKPLEAKVLLYNSSYLH